MRDPEIDEARLFDAGDDLDRMAESFFSLREENVRIPRTTQSVGADDADLVCLHVAQPLAEPPQTRERALLAFVVDKTFVIETRSQANHLAQPVDDRRLAVLIAGHEHVEAVGA